MTTDITTIKNDVMARAKNKGCFCPVCDQFVKVYRRKITSTMARQLLELYKLSDCKTGDWVHTRHFVMGSSGAGDFGKLKFWGLAEPKPHNSGDGGKKSSGYWRITQTGIDFCSGKIAISSHCHIYNNSVIDWEKTMVTIGQALTNKYDYNEIMK